MVLRGLLGSLLLGWGRESKVRLEGSLIRLTGLGQKFSARYDNMFHGLGRLLTGA